MRYTNAIGKSFNDQMYHISFDIQYQMNLDLTIHAILETQLYKPIERIAYSNGVIFIREQINEVNQ
jgi:hypothetical protein